MTASRYTKRPEQVEAITAATALDLAQHAWDELPTWLQTAYKANLVSFGPDTVEVKHPAGPRTASGTDMLVNTGGDSVGVLDSDQFDATYQLVKKDDAS